eukprot:TRINITY_DN17347_c0_g1_i2.p1 TRINITY_DN17347_c0_g1~~TRINITY_DN17347_c0_g1_i2.p1  ORF type:complete len:171 (+),score=40.25 TRINITY_DN17347_c0_g1_i2:85-597(+)
MFSDFCFCVFFFFFKQKTAYEMLRSLVGSEMCIRDSFQRAPALQVLHDKLVNAGVEVIYRNEPGPEHAYKVLFLDGTGFEFAENNSMCFQGIKQAFTRFSTLHGSLPGAPNLSDMYENSQRLTELQLAIFETIDKDPREYVPASYFESLSAVKETWAACKHHYKIREQDS